MDNQSHSNPLVSTVSGVICGIYAYFQNTDFNFGNTSMEMLKIIIYSFLGGVVGQIGRTVVIYLWDKMKEKSKDVCK